MHRLLIDNSKHLNDQVSRPFLQLTELATLWDIAQQENRTKITNKGENCSYDEEHKIVQMVTSTYKD